MHHHFLTVASALLVAPSVILLVDSAALQLSSPGRKDLTLNTSRAMQEEGGIRINLQIGRDFVLGGSCSLYKHTHLTAKRAAYTHTGSPPDESAELEDDDDGAQQEGGETPATGKGTGMSVFASDIFWLQFSVPNIS